MKGLSKEYSIEDIHEDAIEQLQKLQANGQLSVDDITVLTRTRTSEEVLDYAKQIIQDKNSTKVKEKLNGTVNVLTERLDRFQDAIDVLVRLAPSPMGIDVAGLLWGSLKFVLMVCGILLLLGSGFLLGSMLLRGTRSQEG